MKIAISGTDSRDYRSIIQIKKAARFIRIRCESNEIRRL